MLYYNQTGQKKLKNFETLKGVLMLKVQEDKGTVMELRNIMEVA